MLSDEVLAILDSPWVQAKRDKKGRETWGWELKEGVPPDVVEAFKEFQDASDFEDEMQGNTL